MGSPFFVLNQASDKKFLHCSNFPLKCRSAASILGSERNAK